uniref:Uncharacterized protein n=1 Tax=Onchocerca volvulus TaxID=6282 RepID=A0A8R1XLG0_ONCVO
METDQLANSIVILTINLFPLQSHSAAKNETRNMMRFTERSFVSNSTKIAHILNTVSPIKSIQIESSCLGLVVIHIDLFWPGSLPSIESS